jgi:hypothetical protein
MARGIVVTHAGETSSFALEKLERAKLYGSRRRVAIDEEGNVCSRAAMTDDGRVVLRSGMTAQGYFDPDGRQVETSALEAVDEQGRALALVPSTLGVAQPAEGPVDPRHALDLTITAVYRLEAESVGAALAASLATGSVFRIPFNYRPDYRSETAYLVQNDAGCFALVGVPAAATWLEPDAPPPVDDAADDESDLDFDMF